MDTKRSDDRQSMGSGMNVLYVSSVYDESLNKENHNIDFVVITENVSGSCKAVRRFLALGSQV